MIEIIALVFLTKALAREAGSRGRSAGWAAMGPILWILFEVTALVMLGHADTMTQLFVGMFAGAIGGAIAYVGVSLLPKSEWAAEGDALL
jgi:hypothetical protein